MGVVVARRRRVKLSFTFCGRSLSASRATSGSIREGEHMDDNTTLAHIRAMFAPMGTGGFDQLGIVCPFCPISTHGGASYVHMKTPRVYAGNDRYDASHHFDMDVRGDVTVLHFSCEEGGHRWALVLGEHKGGIFVSLVPEEGEEEDGEPRYIQEIRRLL